MAKYKQVVFDADDVSEACEELERCREVLLIGLASYGEVERLSGVQSNYASELYDFDQDHMQPIHPELMVQYEDQSLETVTNFARALMYVDILMRKMRNLTEQEPVAAQAEAQKEVQS
jgi:hypothetical protein